MADFRCIDITRVENGMGLVMRADLSPAEQVDEGSCLTIKLPCGSEVSLPFEDAVRLNKGLEGLLMVSFEPSSDCGCAANSVCLRNNACPRLTRDATER